MVRPKLPEGQRRQDIDPAKRGFPQLGRVSQAVKDRMDTYRGTRSYTEALTTLLDACEAPPTAQPEPAAAPAPVPWSAIKDALLEEFGLRSADRIDRALHKAGMPQK